MQGINAADINQVMMTTTRTSDTSNFRPHYQNPPWPLRACEECKRKKTKCDMRRPTCTLCLRVGSHCIFPTKRKRPDRSGKVNRCARPQRGENGAHALNEPEKGARGPVQSTLEGMRGGTVFLNAQTEPATVMGEQDAHTRTSGLVAEADESVTQSVINDIGTRVHVGDMLTFQESFSPSIAAIFLEDGISDQNFWHPSDSFSSPEFQQTNSSFPQRLDHNAASFGLRSFVAEVSVTPAVASRSNGLEQKSYALTVSEGLVKELVEIFFDRVSGFLPIFHRPRFYARHFPTVGESTVAQGLSLETALILNGIMSLAARFSNSADFMGVVPTRRGDIFAREAQSIYADATRLQGEEFAPSLQYLQGCILLAFYHNTNASNSFGWTLTGVCTRLAYDLEIDLVDEDICDQADPSTAQSDAAEDWVLREELRRAWWSVWELDTFASTVARRPYTIDRTKMYVLLPVSDECWFNEQPIGSALMGTNPTTAWRSLQGSPNQDERAWFLVANFLMSLAYDLKATKMVSLQSKTEMESALDCFSLSLPAQFRTTPCSFVFSDSTFVRSNWIITTKIILQSARTYQALTVCVSEGSTPSPSASPISIQPTAEEQQVACQKCVQHAKDVLRAMKVWSPDYISFSSPFIVCSLVGPASMHILQASSEEPTAALSRLDRDIVYLGISQFARYWGLGSLMLELTHALDKMIGHDSTSLTEREGELATRYAQIAPAFRARARSKSSPFCPPFRV